MITERTLRQWRKDALKRIKDLHTVEKGSVVTGELLNVQILHELELEARILRLTQELLDQHLLRKE